MQQRSALVWQAHPARQRPFAAMFALLAIAGLAVAASVWMTGPAWAVLTVVVMIGSLSRFFFPSEYRIDDQGVVVCGLWGRRSVRWAEIRRVVHDQNGVFLSPRNRRSWLDSYRGLYLVFASNREQVLAAVRRGRSMWSASQ